MMQPPTSTQARPAWARNNRISLALMAIGVLTVLLIPASLSNTLWFGFASAVGATAFAAFFSTHLTGRFSLTSQFIYLMGLFLGGRFFLAFLFPSYPIVECFLFSRTILTEPQIFEMTITYVVSTFGVIMGIALSKPSRDVAPITSPRPLPIVRQATLMFLIPIILLMAYNSYFLLAKVISGGYVSFFLNPENYLDSGVAPGLVSRLALILISLYFFSAPEKVETKFLVMILIVGVLGSATGQRAPLFTSILLIIWARVNYNQKSINLGTLIAIGLCLVVVGQSFITLRSGYSYSIFEMPREFIHLNGISLCTLSYVIAYPDLTGPGAPNYLFAPISDYFMRLFGGIRDLFYSERSLDLLDASGYLSYHLTYTVNPNSFFAGYGTGTSFLAEFYAMTGPILIFVPSVVLGLFLVYLDRNLLRSRFLLLMLPMVLYQIVYSPRDAIFKAIENFVPLTIVYVLTLGLYQLLSGRRRKPGPIFSDDAIVPSAPAGEPERCSDPSK